MILPIKHKVFAYITHRNRLLVFRHTDYPQAGIQVPAGTIEMGESPIDAVLREASEETGHANLSVSRFAGEQFRDMSDYGRAEIHHRRFYHLVYEGNPLDTWDHFQRHPSDGGSPIRFEFFWVELKGDVPPLVADHDALVPRLLKMMGLLPWNDCFSRM